jgi:hypothetical protein
LDGSTRARLGLGAGVVEMDELLGEAVGVTGGELRCCAELLWTFSVLGLALWLVR